MHPPTRTATSPRTVRMFAFTGILFAGLPAKSCMPTPFPAQVTVEVVDELGHTVPSAEIMLHYGHIESYIPERRMANVYEESVNAGLDGSCVMDSKKVASQLNVPIAEVSEKWLFARKRGYTPNIASLADYKSCLDWAFSPDTAGGPASQAVPRCYSYAGQKENERKVQVRLNRIPSCDEAAEILTDKVEDSPKSVSRLAAMARYCAPEWAKRIGTPKDPSARLRSFLRSANGNDAYIYSEVVYALGILEPRQENVKTLQTMFRSLAAAPDKDDGYTTGVLRLTDGLYLALMRKPPQNERLRKELIGRYQTACLWNVEHSRTATASDFQRKQCESQALDPVATLDERLRKW